jgi:hypothetical protein
MCTSVFYMFTCISVAAIRHMTLRESPVWSKSSLVQVWSQNVAKSINTASNSNSIGESNTHGAGESSHLHVTHPYDCSALRPLICSGAGLHLQPLGIRQIKVAKWTQLLDIQRQPTSVKPTLACSTSVKPTLACCLEDKYCLPLLSLWQ